MDPEASTKAGLHHRRSWVAASTHLNASSASFLHLVSVPSGGDVEESAVDHCGSGFVLHEDNYLRHLWTVLVVFVLLYTATVFLFRLCFCSFYIGMDGEEPIGVGDVGWDNMDRFVDIIFWCDILVNFFLSYKDDERTEVDSLRLIAKNYLTGYFVIDLLACLPQELVEAIIHASGGLNKVGRIARMQRISRLGRLMRLTRLVKLNEMLQTHPWWRWLRGLRVFRVVNFISGLLLTIHFLACFWYLCAALHDDPEVTWVGRRSVDQHGTSLLSQGPFEQWLVAMYFVLTVFTTVGFGDIAAGTEAEILIVGFTMVVGAVVHGIIVSKVISTVTSTDQIHEFIETKHRLIDSFATHAEVAESMRKRMKDEIRWRAKARFVESNFDRTEMAELITGKTLPRGLLEEVSAGLFDGSLARNFFLRSHSIVFLPPRLPLLLACYSARIEFNTGEVVYQMHDFPFNLFLVLRGTFALVARPTAGGGVDEMHVDSPVAEADLEVDSVFKWIQSTTRCGSPAEPGLPSSSSRISSELYPYRLFSHCNYFGDLELFLGGPRKATARCERQGAALVLHKSLLLTLEEQFPHFREAWTAMARRREHFRRRSVRRLRYALSLRHFAALRIQICHRARKEHMGQGMTNRARCISDSFEAMLERRLAPQLLVENSADARLHVGSEHARAGRTDSGSVDQPQLEALQRSVNELRRDVDRRMDATQAELKAFRAEVRQLLLGRGGAKEEAASDRLRGKETI
mmetsp:Transcript_123516/g.384492  ORF Transcript_123516/g.384492 Transcript_123516/m.384492 type:complete len:745 (-) Transcript_123516:306-2540(-)